LFSDPDFAQSAVLGLVTIEVDNLAIFIMRPPAIIGRVIDLAGAMIYRLICNWCDAVANAIFRTLADFSCIRVGQNTICVTLTLKPLAMLFFAKSF